MWTSQQQNAISAPVSNMLVTAGAGSGKTAVMVERIIKKVTSENPVDIDKILIVTYTNAAAAEIRERITNALLKKLDENPESYMLQRQLSLINKANICTIHSFCLAVIKSNFNSIGIDPDFKIGDSTEITILKNQALEEVLDEAYESDDEDFLKLVRTYTKKNDSALMEMINSLYNFSMSMPDPENWLESACKSYENPQSNSCIDYMLSKAVSYLDYALSLYDEGIKLCAVSQDFSAFREFLTIEQDSVRNVKYKVQYGWNDGYNAINQVEFKRRPAIKTNETYISDTLKTIRDNAKSVVKTIKENIFTSCAEDMRDDFVFLYPYVKKLTDLTNKYREKFYELKRNRKLVDFNDFEHFTLKILRNADGSKSDVAKNISEDFEEIYVDEYQDCNNVQETIFSLISSEKEGKPNLFMVGDVKQSIYKFRDANPSIFIKKESSYEDYDAEKDLPECKIQLNKNFRSRKEILDGVNFIFSQIMSNEIGEIDYTEKDYLTYGASYENNDDFNDNISVCILENNDISNDEELSSIELESKFVAQEIKRIVSDENIKVFDKTKGVYRQVRYSDIVILLRSTKNKAEYFENALMDLGIPAYSDIGGGYFEASEIRELISLLKIICNPLDDINLVTVMRSALYNFNDDELASIRLAERDDYFYNASLVYAENHDDKITSKLKRLFFDLNKFKKHSKYMPVGEFIWYVINETNYLSYISTFANYEQKKANIRIFAEQGISFEKGNFKGLYNFINYLDNIKLRGGDMDSAKIIGENENVVRIMSIHKSKGLEFPVVFLSMCNKKFNLMDSYGSMILHKELGIGMEYIDYDNGFSFPLITKNAIKMKLKSETLSEEERVLYVALTRAKEKLYITGVVNDFDAYIQKCADMVSTTQDVKLSPNITENVQSYLDWIMLSLVRHHDTPVETLVHYLKTDSKFKIVSANIENDVETLEKETEIPSNTEKKYTDEIKRRLEYSYKYKDVNTIPTNVTVTEIKRILNDNDEGYKLYRKSNLTVPRFMVKDADMPKNAIGTLTHLAMQKINLTQGINEDTIREDICRLVSDNFVTDDEAKYIDSSKIYAFFCTDIGKKMLCSSRVYREYPFKIMLSANEIFDLNSSGENLVVQGTIDAFFYDENGDIILVDYKTDKVKTTAEDIADKYKNQIKYYKIAIEKITGKKVSESYIYLFDTGQCVKC